VQRDLLAGDPGWEVLAHPPGAAPRVEVLTPSLDNAIDSADRLALVLPPPSSVRLRVEPRDGEVLVRPLVGVDLSVARGLDPGGGPLRVAFELRARGELVGTATVPTYPKQAREIGAKRHEQNRWQPIGPRAGVPLVPGDVLELSTRLEGAAPEGTPGAGALLAGFARLSLERREERPRRRADRRHPNVVLVVMDTERADRTTPYGYGRPTTPNLARLARRGTVFETAYSTSSWTWPATASILTGRPPEAHGVVDERSSYLADELTTLAEVLQDAGYSTAGFSGNPIVSSSRNFDKGFEIFRCTDRSSNGDEVVPHALEWLADHAAYRFFLYLQLQDPHTPHEPRPEHLREFCGTDVMAFEGERLEVRATSMKRRGQGWGASPPGVPPAEARWFSDVYDACVAGGDHWLGVLLDELERLGLADTTFVAYTSDHGEELLEHGHLYHSHDLWEELVRVPLVVAGPGVAAGARRTVPVSNRHLAATLARAAGAAFPGADAVDLFAPRQHEEAIFFETRTGWWRGEFAPILGVRRGQWVLHWCPDAEPEQAFRLFDVAADPAQSRDVASRHPDVVQRLRAEILRERERLAPQRPSGKSRAGKATRELLEKMGYAGSRDDEE